MADTASDIFIFLPMLLAVVGFAVLFYTGGRDDEREKWKGKLINLGLAHYDPKTAEWKWNDDIENDNGGNK